MSWQAVRAIRDVQTGSATKKAVLYVMADYAKEDGTSIFASLGSIAERAELSRRSVITAVSELCSQGILLKEHTAPGHSSTYSINPQIMAGSAEVSAPATCEGDSHPPMHEIHTPCETDSHPPVKDVHTPVKEIHTPCETASHYISIKDPLEDPNRDQRDDTAPVLELFEIEPDPWYDPNAFPNEDLDACLIAQAIQSVPKFEGSAERDACRKIAAQLREQFPLGASGEIDRAELAEFLEEWAVFNRNSKRRGGSKDGAASLKNWVRLKEAQHRNTRRARLRDQGQTGGRGLLSGHELAALQFGGGAA